MHIMSMVSFRLRGKAITCEKRCEIKQISGIKMIVIPDADKNKLQNKDRVYSTLIWLSTPKFGTTTWTFLKIDMRHRGY